jgi:hypothetical protein
MPRFRKKPVVIEARQLTDTNAAELLVWINDHFVDDDVAAMRGGPGGGSRGATLYIKTLEGTHLAEVGDWIIRGVHHEFYPCKPDIFAKTYDEVE